MFNILFVLFVRQGSMHRCAAGLCSHCDIVAMVDLVKLHFDFDNVPKTSSREESDSCSKSCEVGKHHLRAQAGLFIREAQGKPMLFTY